MSFTTCICCGSRITWDWEEAFDKFGFNDGDGTVMTEKVAHALRKAGYTVKTEPWALHNVTITQISLDGRSCIPDGTDLGYDDPRNYLPDDIVQLLDAEFPADKEVQP